LGKLLIFSNKVCGGGVGKISVVVSSPSYPKEYRKMGPKKVGNLRLNFADGENFEIKLFKIIIYG